ncbi:transcriptional repressor p66-alpha-like [Uloborus diversus]|uniref:transcriptional repressor p66-alpha-like n=1 Tax=Uloborus diversus TaxID=327109 RepID=UPI002409D410|nr:transcriptional repressor p66-alpha-like [Uloborus diversus]
MRSTIEEYQPRNVYAIDETGLFFRALPDKAINLKNEFCILGEMAEERLTLLLGANMEGEKLIPLVIGKAPANGFKELSVLKASIECQFNRRAWMNADIMMEYLRNLDELFVKENRNVLLFVDNAICHPRDIRLKNSKIIFLPPHASNCHPLDPIIKNLKVQYRQLLLKHLIRKTKRNVSAINVAEKISLLDAVGWIKQVWNKVDEETIKDCFQKAGFTERVVPKSDPEENENSRVLQDLMGKCGFGEVLSEEFATMDSDLAIEEEVKEIADIVKEFSAEHSQEENQTPQCDELGTNIEEENEICSILSESETSRVPLHSNTYGDIKPCLALNVPNDCTAANEMGSIEKEIKSSSHLFQVKSEVENSDDESLNDQSAPKLCDRIMPKEWNGPSDYFAAGMFANQNRKAIFRSILSPEGHARPFSAMEFEEAADLSVKKEKPSSYDSRDKSSYQSSYSLDETMDLSTKWRAPPTSERKAATSIGSTFAQPASASSASETDRTMSDHKRSKSGHHSRMLPRKRLHIAPNMESQPLQNSASSCSSPDVIVLSDEDKPRFNGHLNGYESDSKNSDSELSEMPPLPPEKSWDPEKLKEKRKLLRELRDELRSEEMKLVLLKKLHQSQMIKDNLLNQAAAAAVAGKMVPTTNRGASNAAPPPLVRSGQIPQPSNKMLSQQLSHQSALLNTPQMCNQSAHGGPPPLIGQRCNNTTGGNSSNTSSSNLMSGMMRPGSHNSVSRTPVTTPPNMVMGYNLHNLQQSVQNNQHQLSMTQTTPQACPSPSSIQPSQLERMDNQTPAQRQAAAKLALRKQLEKTLLQIPPPKPPPPEMHFVPNANNQEFICLLGLEKVVDFLTEDPNINRPPPEPFECVQCGTDFSPVWKWQDAGRSRMHKPSVICETCVTSNIKKALKAEHTNRLKTAFVKALQQEQEIEQRMSQAMPSPPPPVGISPTHTPCSTPTPAIVTSSGPSPPAPHSPVHGLMQKMGAGAGAMVSSASLLQHLPKLSAAHQSLLHAQAQQLQHFAQTMPQPQPAHMLPFAPLLAAQAYSYQLLGKNPMSSAELQRQYLLDMIPPRSLPQGSINWKT